jgi:hypothetical protein
MLKTIHRSFVYTLLMLFVFICSSGVQHILCCVCLVFLRLVYTILLVSLDCPFFIWSLYCLSMFLLVVILPVHVSFGSCIACPCFNDQKKHGQTIQRPKETWTGNITTKRKMDRQYFHLVVVLSVHVSFGRCIVYPCFFWSLYCLSMFFLAVVYQKKHGQTIQQPK